MEEFQQRFPQVKDVMLDGVERPIQRPRSAKRQTRHYSGKKKSHRRKNVVMTDAKRRVLVLTPSKPGRRHDKNLVDRSQLVQNIPAALLALIQFVIREQVCCLISSQLVNRHHALRPQGTTSPFEEGLPQRGPVRGVQVTEPR